MVGFLQETKLKAKKLSTFDKIWSEENTVWCSVEGKGLSRGLITMLRDDFFVEEERVLHSNFILVTGKFVG